MHVIVGEPTGLAISRYAAEHEFELIVMGTHGRGALAHASAGKRRGEGRPIGAVPGADDSPPEHRKAAAERLRETSAPAGKP